MKLFGDKTLTQLEDPQAFSRFLDYARSGSGFGEGKRTIGRLDVDLTLSHRESVEPLSDELPSGFSWYVPALLYTFLGMDRSIFKVFYSQMGRGAEIPTLRKTDGRVLSIKDVDLQSEWYSILQGLPVDDDQQFREWLLSFVVNRRYDQTQFSFGLFSQPAMGHELSVIVPIAAADSGSSPIELCASTDGSLVGAYIA